MYILNKLIKLCIFKYVHIISTWFYILLVLYVFIIYSSQKVIWKLYKNSSFLAASQPLGYILANFYAIYLHITE